MQLSYSKIATYQACPKMYAYRYILKTPEPPHKALSFGLSIHKTLERYCRAYLEQPTLIEEHHPLSITDYLAQSWIDRGYLSRQEARDRYREAEILLQRWEKDFLESSHHLTAVELPFRLPLGDHILSGRFDRVDRTAHDIVIIDYKTGKSGTPERVATDQQLTVYALAARRIFPGKHIHLRMVYLEHQSTLTTTRSDAELQEAQEDLLATAGAIAQQQFDPTPSVTACSRCPFRSHCPDAETYP